MRTGWPAAVLTAVAGLVVLGAATAAWVVERGTTEIGGVEVAEVTGVTGAELQPGLMLVGLVLVIASLGVGLAGGALRRALGALVLVTGTVGAALSVAGTIRAAELAGVLQAAAWWSLAGAALAVAAGALAVRRPDRRATLPARFDIDPAATGPGDPHPPRSARRGEPEGPVETEPDEWDLAVEPDDERR